MSANQKNIHFLLHSHTIDMRNLVNLTQNITSMIHNNFTAWNHVTQNSSYDRNHKWKMMIRMMIIIIIIIIVVVITIRYTDTAEVNTYVSFPDEGLTCYPLRTIRWGRKTASSIKNLEILNIYSFQLIKKCNTVM